MGEKVDNWLMLAVSMLFEKGKRREEGERGWAAKDKNQGLSSNWTDESADADHDLDIKG